jgi:hypothetical protein
VHLLPIYDEYVNAYRDRMVVHLGPATAGWSTFQHVLVIAGQIAGTWHTPRNGKSAQVEVVPLRTLTNSERRAVGTAVDEYTRFRG